MKARASAAKPALRRQALEDAHETQSCQPPATEMQVGHERQIGISKQVESEDLSRHIKEGSISG